MTESGAWKADAIALHDNKVEKFQDWYREMAEDPYGSTFAYGRRKIEDIIERVTGSLPPGAKVLDVGCGTGFNISRLRSQGFNTVGVEPAPAMRAEALANNPGCEIVDGDIEGLPFAPCSFDLVMTIETIRYLKAPNLAFSELARVLRPGGRAIITAAPRWSLNGYALINMLTSRVTVPGFTRVKQSFMSVGEARRALESAGFASSEIYGAFLGPWHVLGRISPRRLAPALRAWEPLDQRIANLRLTRDLTNHLVLVGKK